MKAAAVDARLMGVGIRVMIERGVIGTGMVGRGAMAAGVEGLDVIRAGALGAGALIATAISYGATRATTHRSGGQTARLSANSAFVSGSDKETLSGTTVAGGAAAAVGVGTSHRGAGHIVAIRGAGVCPVDTTQRRSTGGSEEERGSEAGRMVAARE